MAELDLSGGGRPAGDSDGDEREPGQSERSKRRHRQKEREAAGNLNARLQAIFDRLADRFEGKGDLELATIIREDSRAMVGGLVSLTKRLPGAAAPILLVLGVVEPVLAFGRLLRLFANRWAARRYAGEHEQLEGDEQLEGELPPQTVAPFCGRDDCELPPDVWHHPHEHTPEGILYL